MKTYHVGGLNPIHRVKTLAEALQKARHDDCIEIHKTIKESVTIQKPICINGNGHKWIAPAGVLACNIQAQTMINDLTFEIESRANAISTESETLLNRVNIAFKGPVTAFYPSIIVRKGTRHEFTECILAKVSTYSDTKVLMKDCHLYSYYGELETTERTDASLCEGTVYLEGGSVSQATFYDVNAKDTVFGHHVQVHDAQLTRITLSGEDVAETKPYRMTEKQRKKEPENGPLSKRTDNQYMIYGTGKVEIVNYRTANTVPKDWYGFYFQMANVLVKQCRTQEALQHFAVKSALSFVDCQEGNYWQVNDSTLQQIRSTVHTNSKQQTAMEQLNQLIGLKEVKTRLQSLLNTIQMQQTGDLFSNHMIFAGNAGTGKTTVAKIVAQALFEVGVIPENKCTFASADTLIKGYVGQTASNVAEICENAMGGVLFIDEAYQLTVKQGENSFNSEALSVLIRYMEDYRDQLVVIAAGYSKEMRELLASNIGLSRRFQWIEFADYTPEEMAKIFEYIRQKQEDQYDASVDTRIIPALFEKLTQLYLSHPDANGRVTNGGNGGLVRNVYQRIVLAKNDRYMLTGDGNACITKQDIIAGFEAEIKDAIQKLGITERKNV